MYNLTCNYFWLLKKVLRLVITYGFVQRHILMLLTVAGKFLQIPHRWMYLTWILQTNHWILKIEVYKRKCRLKLLYQRTGIISGGIFTISNPQKMNKITVSQLLSLKHLYYLCIEGQSVIWFGFLVIGRPNWKYFYVKFIYFEKATKFCEIFTLLLS